jgi:glycosyltransferase involved in cell wall biosynthesis
MPTSPPVTVILPAHNAEATILPAIASTLNQTYTDFELWVLENGSTDRTAEIARSFTDPRVRVLELGPVGLRGAMQYAIENAPSEWLARMDADDIMFPDRLKVQVNFIQQQPGFVFVGTAFAFLTPFGHIFQRVLSSPSREVDISLLSRGKFFANPSTLFRRRVALEVSSIDPEFAMDDNPMWFRMLKRGKGWEIAEPLHLYRVRPNSWGQDMNFYREQRRAREKYAPESLSRFPEIEKRISRWFEVASLELITGDKMAVRRAAEGLEQDGFGRAARMMRGRSYLAPVSWMYYRWRNRNYYRHRPDWEQLFAPLLQMEISEHGDDKASGHAIVKTISGWMETW